MKIIKIFSYAAFARNIPTQKQPEQTHKIGKHLKHGLELLKKEQEEESYTDIYSKRDQLPIKMKQQTICQKF